MNPQERKTQSIAELALLVSATLVLSYLEASMPLPVTVPGIKLGLANVCILCALYLKGPRWAGGVTLFKAVAASAIVGAPSMIVYSLAGSSLALAGMIVLWRIGTFNLKAVSVAAALLHGAGQLAVAAFMLQTPIVFVNAPVMIVASVVAGIVTGSVAEGTLRVFPASQRRTETAQPLRDAIR